MEEIAAETLPPGTSFEWTELAFQERQTGNTAIFIFGLSVLFVFLALAAQYESWIMPFAIVLIVPLGVLAALLGVALRGLDNNILVQIGLIVLIGLAAKNAILIVEFARQAQERGAVGGRGGGRGLPAAAAADPDDGLRLHPRRRAAGDRHRPRRRNAPVARHRGVLRHARRDALRPVPDAGLLRDAAIAVLKAQATGRGEPRHRRRQRRFRRMPNSGNGRISPRPCRGCLAAMPPVVSSRAPAPAHGRHRRRCRRHAAVHGACAAAPGLPHGGCASLPRARPGDRDRLPMHAPSHSLGEWPRR